MKTSTKIKLVGFSMLLIAITLIVLGGVVLKDTSWSLGWKPNFALFVPGCFLAVLSLPVIFLGFHPQIMKAAAKLQNEALDTAGKEIGSAMQKTAVVASPAIKTVVKTVKEGLSEPTMFCKKCGKGITADSEFCKFCGTEQK